MRMSEAEYQALMAKRKVSGVEVLKKIQRRSKLELALLAQMEAERLPTPFCEYRPLPHRKFRLDFAWPKESCGGVDTGIEVQGMVHRIKGRFKRDIEKRAELLLAGWRVLEVDGDSIRDGRAIGWIKRLIGAAQPPCICGEHPYVVCPIHGKWE